jgi:hypothetical protein
MDKRKERPVAKTDKQGLMNALGLQENKKEKLKPDKPTLSSLHAVGKGTKAP